MNQRIRVVGYVDITHPTDLDPDRKSGLSIEREIGLLDVFESYLDDVELRVTR